MQALPSRARRAVLEGRVSFGETHQSIDTRRLTPVAKLRIIRYCADLTARALSARACGGPDRATLLDSLGRVRGVHQ